MATFAEIQQDLVDVATAVTGFSAGLDAVAVEIQALRDQLAAGAVITQEQLDALDAQVETTKADAQAALARIGTM